MSPSASSVCLPDAEKGWMSPSAKKDGCFRLPFDSPCHEKIDGCLCLPLDRTAELIRAYEPSFVTIGFDEPTEAFADKHRAAQKHNFERLRAMFVNAEEFRFACYDPILTKRAVEEQVARIPDVNVVVAPMNTKLSTMGTYLAATENDAIQICYAQAVLYNYLHYSLPGTTCYLFRVQ
jgi:hypothetical protein